MSDNRLSHSVFWSYLDIIGNKAFSFAVYLILAVKLGPYEFGIIAIARLFIDYLDSMSSQGLGLCIIQSDRPTQKLLSTAFWMNFLVAVLLSLGLYHSSHIIAEFYDHSELHALLQLLSIAIVISALGRTHAALLERRMAYKSLAIRSFFASMSGGIVALFLAFNDYGAWSLVWQQITSSIIGCIIMWIGSKWAPSLCIDISSLKKLYIFGSKILLDQQAVFFGKRLDEIVISTSFGAELLGVYSVAKRFQFVLQSLSIDPISRVVMSSFSRFQAETDKIKENYLSSFSICALLVFPLFFSISCLSEALIILTVGEKWISASEVLSVLLICSAISLAPSLLHTTFIARGRPEYPMISNYSKMLLLLALLYSFVDFGLVGIAAAVVIREILGLMIDAYFARKNFSLGFLENISTIARAATPSLIIVIIITILAEYIEPSWTQVLSSAIVCLPVYMAISYKINRKYFLVLMNLFSRQK